MASSNEDLVENKEISQAVYKKIEERYLTPLSSIDCPPEAMVVLIAMSMYLSQLMGLSFSSTSVKNALEAVDGIDINISNIKAKLGIIQQDEIN